VVTFKLSAGAAVSKEKGVTIKVIISLSSGNRTKEE
jgi:hypothetical protein